MMQAEERIGGSTRLCGLIGNPVEHTLSPLIHNTLAAACGCDLAYLPFLVEKERVGEAVRGAYALNVLGLNVTVPYKQAVIPFLQSIDKAAEDVESVNTLVRVPGGYRGYNTDMSGLYRAMREDGARIEEEHVALLGAGGVGRAVAYLCAARGAASLTILNRSPEKAQALAEEIRDKTGHRRVYARPLSEAGSLPEKRYLAIQATSVGLYPDCGRAAVEETAFYEKIHTGYDLIYRPERTKFMRLVQEQGGQAFNGLKMLLYQGVEAFELWNGVQINQQQAGELYEILKGNLESEFGK
ncbi:MAG: shikimate dehydrogenase [Eubacteriales bacterium]|nr:shikimate dehydrogenase [Eubacteriales bacterium]